MKDDNQQEYHGTNVEGSEDELSHKTTGKSESEETLTNRQGHPVTDNQNVRTVGNRGPTTLENYDFLEKSATLTGNAFLNVSFMQEARGLTGILKLTEVLETSRFRSTHGQSFFKKRVRKRRHLFVFQQSIMENTHLRHYGTRAVLPLSCIPKTETGIWSGTT